MYFGCEDGMVICGHPFFLCPSVCYSFKVYEEFGMSKFRALSLSLTDYPGIKVYSLFPFVTTNR